VLLPQRAEVEEVLGIILMANFLQKLAEVVVEDREV
jgi:hypothetical protein